MRCAFPSRLGFILGLIVVLGGYPVPSHATSLSEALERVYRDSPELLAQRADTRATDENVSIAFGGFRPTASAGANWGYDQQTLQFGGATQTTKTHPGGLNVSVSQNIFNGFKDTNGVERAETLARFSQQSLRNTEASVLVGAVSAYMNVLRDTAALALRQSTLSALQLQLESTRIRLAKGEVTRTDISQSESALAQGQIDLANAQSALRASQAVYRQLIGDAPQQLAPARPLDALIPKSLESALAIADVEHPLNLAAAYNVTASELAVKIAKGQLLPTLSVGGSFSRQQDYSFVKGEYANNSTIAAQLNVPIYEGGINYAQARQASEKLGQAHLQADQQRALIRSNVTSLWASVQGNREALAGANAQVKAAESALNGVREEAKFGERTTQDILTAQQLLTNARIGLITAQRDRVVLSYNLIATIGHLSAETLGLKVEKYDPTVHLNRIRGKLFGFD